MQSRRAAAEVLSRVCEGGSLARVLPEVLDASAEEHRAQIQALSYGALRYYERLDFLLGQLLRKRLRQRDRIVEDILRIGLFELIEARTPEHAIVNNAVKAARKARSWASGMVNASLRRFIRERGQLLALADHDRQSRWLLPEWLLDRIVQAYPEDWRRCAAGLSQPAPMTLRVNHARLSTADYQARLQVMGIDSSVVPCVDTALQLATACPVNDLPGFGDGDVSVQDAAAQLAAGLLNAKPGQRVLDACAAPGGKTVHILEAVDHDIDLLAIDVDAARLQRVTENLERMGGSAKLVAQDAAAVERWWDGSPFDRILLDAPCSATGVIRRHPDIKQNRRPEDLQTLKAQQARLLDALWTTLAPGGQMLYVTCSILPEENSQQVALFLQRQADARELPLDVGWGSTANPGRQILPGSDNMDGFFYCCLQKE